MRMEELKELVTLISDVPQFVLWVLIGYLIYKLALLGSIYGVIRYVAGELFGWLRAQKVEIKQVRPILDDMVITGNLDRLVVQIGRLCGKGTGIQSRFLHPESIEWLAEAIDEKEARERQKK